MHTAESGPDAGPGHLLLGISYLLTDLALTEVGVFSLNAIRFLLAFAVGGLCSLPRMRHPSAATPQDRSGHRSGPLLRVHRHHLRVKYTSLSNASNFCAPCRWSLPAGLSVLPPQALPEAGPGAGHGGDGHRPAPLSDDLRPALGTSCASCAPLVQPPSISSSQSGRWPVRR